MMWTRESEPYWPALSMLGSWEARWESERRDRCGRLSNRRGKRASWVHAVYLTRHKTPCELAVPAQYRLNAECAIEIVWEIQLVFISS
jgi:hypothetical protein